MQREAGIVLNNRGEWALQQGDLDVAEALFERAGRIFDQYQHEMLQVGLNLNRGDLALRQNEPAKAIRFFDRINDDYLAVSYIYFRNRYYLVLS